MRLKPGILYMKNPACISKFITRTITISLLTLWLTNQASEKQNECYKVWFTT